MRRIIFVLVIISALVSAVAFFVTDAQARDVNSAYGSEFIFAGDSIKTDSIHVKADSSKPAYVVKDSTYLRQLTYRRQESPTAQPFSLQNPFYLKNPSVIQRIVELDSTGTYVIVREKIGDKDIKIPIKIPLEEYVKQRSQNDFNKNFAEMIAKQSAGAKKKNDLADLLGSFTNIDIPIPANPVFSIFGPPRINLVIAGAVDIRAAFRTTTTDQQTTSVLGNTRNEPDFAQEVQINVNGTIGDKLNILADWNTQRTFEYENQLKIKYTGYEDEIVQSVEAGNVSLATSSSFVSSSSALFGIKAGFQIGPLKLTAIASQKKGQIQEKSVTGGASEREFVIRAWQYSKDHFFVDTSYISLFEPYIKDRQLINSRLQIKENEYEVWVTHVGQEDPNSRQANAFIDLPTTTLDDTTTYKSFRGTVTEDAGKIEHGLWDKLESGKDYDLDLNGGYITMKRSIQDGQAIAIAYRIENGVGGSLDDLLYGTLTKRESGADSVLVLKLIKPKNLLPQHRIAWSLMMKNYYYLGGSKIQKSGFSLDIKYEIPGQDPVNTVDQYRWINLLGLDDYGSDPSVKKPDGEFDYRPLYTIDEERGEIIFPTLKPFTEGIHNAFKTLGITVSDTSYLYDNLYDTIATAAQNNTLRDRFIIIGKITASSSNTINLGFNIVEGSVQVLLDGRALTPNVDYTVDYIIGQVIIKNQAALVPGANMQVKYEQNDLFQLASKTLLGTRGEVKLSEKTQFGFTILNLNEQTLSDKVRLGEEPKNNSMYGFDGQTSGDLPFLTKAIDALPFIDTKAKSDFSIRGEVAYMSPDPNTKKSPIAGDNGKSIAYIDDFEGAKRIIPLGVGYSMWHDMSAPAYQYNVDTSLTSLILDTTKIKSKAKAYWYNLSNSVRVNDIYGFDANGNPVKSAARGSEFVTVLNINYNPRVRGEYNFSENLRQTLLADPKKNWGGMQRYISSSAIDLVRENINFIEVWVRIEKGKIDSTKKILIDLGAVSEDVIPNGRMDTEDKGSYKDGVINSDAEDTGIDGKNDDEERRDYANFLRSNQWSPDSLPDPSGDPSGDDWNWQYGSNDFRTINGTENNHKLNGEGGQYSNSEDLNRNYVLEKANNYFEYELNLDTAATNPQRIGGGYNSWYQYRIPIINFKNKIGSPDFSLIEFARVWFTGHDDEVEIRLADFNLIGNQWEEVVKNDSTFSLSVVNYEDNSLQGYSIPPGVIREKDRTKPDENILGNEQSLALNFSNLKDGQNRQAIKRYSYKPLDVFSYKEMKMFVHGDKNFATTPDKATAKVFIRFGADSLNYYEYKAPIYPGWERNNISIRFEDLTSIKQVRDSSTVRKVIPVAGGPDSATYAVLGNPSLTTIKAIYIGIENPVLPGTNTNPITGQIWVNELRLVDVDDTPGWAFSISTALRLADLGTLAFTFTQVDPYFHSLENPFGSRTTTTSWNVASSISFEKFLPQEWTGTSLPFSYSHTEQIIKPKYLQSSDIIVDKAADLAKENTIKKTNSEVLGEQAKQKIVSESQTVSTTDTYAMPSFKFNVPVNFWFFQNIFNRIGYGFNYTYSKSRSNTVAYRTSWQWNARLSYGYTFDPNYYIQPFAFFEGIPVLGELQGLQLYYFPISNISSGFNIARSRSYEQVRTQSQANPPVRGLSAARNFSFGWKLTEGGLLNLSGDYSVDISSSLVHLEVDRYGRQRDFQQILEKIFLQDQLINFGYDNSYSQTINVNTKPRVPALFDLNKYVTLSARYSVAYRWQNNLQQGERGIGVGWGNSISLGTDISLKSFVETWFPSAPSASNSSVTQPVQTRGTRNRSDDEDTLQTPEAPLKDTVKVQRKPGEGLIGIARTLIKTPFLDYDKINVSFTQSNNVTNGGVPGRPGFANLFGRVPFVQTADRQFGPSRAYQLGLVSVPGANITDVFIKSQFPFIGFSTDAAKQIRAKGVTMSDAFSQNNKVTIRTSRDLWTGARIDLNWNLGWSYSRNQNITTDPTTGRVTIGSTAIGGSIERSFFTMPPTLFLSMFKSGIEDVGKKFDNLIKNTSDTRSEDEKLAEAFEQGMESLPVLKKIFGKYFPRANYSLRWDGLEQLAFFKTFATRVSLDHAYQSSYSTSFRGSSGEALRTESQRISYGFSPLVGLNISFKEVLKGTMSANARYSSTKSYDLTPSSKNISESGSNEMSLTWSPTRQGFEIPLFGLSLQNDIDISFTYSYAKSSRTTYEAKNKIFNIAGTPGEGSSRSQMEPRIRYVLSSRVNAAVFYRYTKITPDAGGSRIPGSSTNEGGLDVHITIQ